MSSRIGLIVPYLHVIFTRNRYDLAIFTNNQSSNIHRKIQSQSQIHLYIRLIILCTSVLQPLFRDISYTDYIRKSI